MGRIDDVAKEYAEKHASAWDRAPIVHEPVREALREAFLAGAKWERGVRGD